MIPHGVVPMLSTPDVAGGRGKAIPQAGDVSGASYTILSGGGVSPNLAQVSEVDEGLSGTSLGLATVSALQAFDDPSGTFQPVSLTSNFSLNGDVRDVLNTVSAILIQNSAATDTNFVQAIDTTADDHPGDNFNAQNTASYLFGLNVSTGFFDRLTCEGDDNDGLFPVTTGRLATLSHGALFNGAKWNRQRSASADTNSAVNHIGISAVALVGNWPITSAPAANTQATATKAAGGGGFRHVLTTICADVNAVAAVAAPLVLVVRDGATGVGTILWQRRLTAVIGTTASVQLSGLAIVGSDNTAMTVEFTAAPGATNFETVSATGYTS